ncbi:MAG TPA: site-specific integrase [Gaiellaceae bacterium]|nr:site-specific integrase [Gaiellaceae bacterium]
MPSGACVIEYKGKQGRVFRVKFTDADGRQVMQTVGREADGFTRRDADDALRERLVDVKRDGLAVGRETFAAFVDRFLDVHLPTRGLKPSTVLDYVNTLRGHAVPILGAYKLTEIEQRPELLDGYLATLATEKKLSAKTRANHVSTLHRVFEKARQWKLIRSNPVDAIEKPRVEPPDTVVLDEAEIARLLTAYRELEQAHPEDAWLPVVRRMVLVGLGTALRRGELQGLRWGDVELLEGLLRVRQQFTRGAFSTPKSKASRRVVTFGPKTAAALEEQWNESLRRRDEDLVFGHPHLGTPLDGSKLGAYARKALKRAKIEKHVQPWHGLRHTALTFDSAVGLPNAYVQAKAGHSQFTITERYVHAAQVAFPGAADRAEERLFGKVGAA